MKDFTKYSRAKVDTKRVEANLASVHTLLNELNTLASSGVIEHAHVDADNQGLISITFRIAVPMNVVRIHE